MLFAPHVEVQICHFSFMASDVQVMSGRLMEADLFYFLRCPRCSNTACERHAQWDTAEFGEGTHSIQSLRISWSMWRCIDCWFEQPLWSSRVGCIRRVFRALRYVCPSKCVCVHRTKCMRFAWVVLWLSSPLTNIALRTVFRL